MSQMTYSGILRAVPELRLLPFVTAKRIVGQAQKDAQGAKGNEYREFVCQRIIVLLSQETKP